MHHIPVFLTAGCLVSTFTSFVVSADEDVAVNYKTKRTCALEGSSVNITCSFSFPEGHKVTATHWFQGQSPNNVTHDILQGREFRGRVEYVGDRTHSCSLRITDLLVSDTGIYWFVFETDRSGTPWSSSSGFTLQVTDMSVEVSPLTVMEGEEVDMFCGSCVLSEAPTYTWLRDGQVLASLERTNQLLLEPARVDDMGTYSCRIQGHEATPSHSVRLTVTCAKIDPPKNTTAIVLGRSLQYATLTCSSDANPPVENYTWFKVNESTPVGSGQQYSITNIGSEDGGQYYCEARNKAGAQNSSPILIALQGKAGVSEAVVMGITAAIVCVALAGVAVFCGMKRRHRKPESGGSAAVAKEARPIPGDNTYIALAFKSPNSEYETLANARSETNDYTDEPVGGIYETLDEKTNSG